MTRIRGLLAAVAVFIVGVPLAEKVFAQGIFFSSLNLAGAIADASDGS